MQASCSANSVPVDPREHQSALYHMSTVRVSSRISKVLEPAVLNDALSERKMSSIPDVLSGLQD
jgi:hypothetical protein